MTFLTPVWLALSGLAVVVLVLHMRRRRQLEVPSVLLWRSIENTGAPRRTIRWPPPSLLLALQLLIVLLVAAALAQPLFGGDQGDSDHTIYVIDASASMRATDVAPDRFGNAIETLTDQLNGIDPDTGNRFSVVTVDANPRIQIARQEAPSQVVSVLAELAATDGPADWNAASDLIASLFVGDEVPKIVILSDGSDPAGANIADAFPAVAIERVVIGDSGTLNLGVVADLIATDPEAGEWLLTGAVTFTGIRPPESVLVMVLFRPAGADRFLEWDEVESRRGGAADDPDGDPIDPVSDNFVLQLQLPGPGEIRVELPDDDGAYDNMVDFIVRQEPATARVLYLGPQSLPLVAAILSMDSVDLVEADQLPDNDDDFDLVIVDNVTVPRRPATNVLWVGVGRLAIAAEPTGLQSPTLSGWNAGHPLSEDVTWAGIEPSVGYRIARLSGSTVLLESGGTPLIQARTRPSGREISIAFDIGSSNWPELASFPVFISNVVSWLGMDVGTTIAANCLVGQTCPVESRLLDGTIVAEDGTAVWSIETAGQTYLLPGIENSFVPTLAGLYRLEAGGVTRQIIVDADAAGETSLAAIAGFEGASALSAGSPRVWWWLLLAALLILLLETILAGRGSEHFLRGSGLYRTNPLAARRRVILAVRVVSMAFLVAAIAGLPWLGQEPSEDVVVVLGAGLGPDDQNTDRERVLQQVAD
ncbi:MAG: vWA domain-containing protein, partial [Alphaproteobacteria bacterium]